MKTWIQNVWVWCGGHFEKKDVAVAGEKIAWVGQAPGEFQADQILDGTGKYLLPGVIDCHAHTTMVCGRQHMKDFFSHSDSMLTVNAVCAAERMVRHGITTIRDCGGRGFETLAVRDAVNAGKIPGPWILCSGTPIKVIGGHEPGSDITGPWQARAKVREFLHQGVDFIKVMVTGGLGKAGEDPGSVEMEQEELSAIVSEAKKHGKKVACHCHSREGMERIVLAGADSIEHSTYLDPEINAKIMEKGIYVVPTFLPYMNYALLGQQENQLMDTVLAAQAIIGEKTKRLGQAYRQGVKLAFGRDSGGFMMDQGEFVQEMLYMEAAGVSREDIIQSATQNAADLCGIGDKTGSIEEGKYADLVLLADNPLQDLHAWHRSLEKVCARGRWMDGAREDW